MKIEIVDQDGNIIKDQEFDDDWASVQFHHKERFGELEKRGWPIEMHGPELATFKVREVLAFASVRLGKGAATAQEQRFLAMVMRVLMTAHRIDVSPRGVDRANLASQEGNLDRNAEIRRLYARGDRVRDIAKALGVCEKTVSRALNKRP